MEPLIIPKYVTYIPISFSLHMGLPWWLSGKESACQAGQAQVWSLGWEDHLEKEMYSNPVFCLGNPMDTGAWWAVVHGIRHDLVTKQQQSLHMLYFLWDTDYPDCTLVSAWETLTHASRYSLDVIFSVKSSLIPSERNTSEPWFLKAHNVEFTILGFPWWPSG